MPEPFTPMEITCRTIQGRLLLRPSPELNKLILGVIGRAMSLFEVRVHLFVFLSNHMHMILAAPDAVTISSFMNYINSNIAREAGRLHDWKEKFWGRRYTAIPILDDRALMDRVRYILSHGCKEGLVKRPCDWPGVSCVRALTNAEKLTGIWIDRTRGYLARRGGESIHTGDISTEYQILLSPLPMFAGLSEAERRERMTELVEDIEAETRERLLNEGKSVPGATAAMAKDPHTRPDEPKKAPRPLCHTSTREMLCRYLEAYRHFVSLYRKAKKLFELGRPEAIRLFPRGCHLPSFAWRELDIATASG